MAKYLSRVVVLGLMVISGVFGIKFYDEHSQEAKLRAKDEIIAAEQKKNEVLRGVLRRLQTDKRMARVIVTDQQVRDGRTFTTVLFSEYDPDGKKLVEATTKEFVIEGTTIYVAGYVVEFEDKLVEADDPLRGHSIAVFQRIFGQKGQDAGFELRSAGGDAPLGQENPDKAKAALEREVWKDFWKLEKDPILRAKYGVKQAGGRAAFSEHFEPGYMYTLTLDPRGKLGMDVQPLDPLVDKALRDKRSTPTTGPATRE